jgi:hypothetical protein
MDMMKKRSQIMRLVLAVFLGQALCGLSLAAETPPSGKSGIALVRAVMCESISGYEPRNTAVVFSIEVGRISCFTSFDRITSTTAALHKWYRRDELVTTKRLTLKPPRWATYSSIQLREADKGPWHVDIYDDDNHLLDTLRFSVTD